MPKHILRTGSTFLVTLLAALAFQSAVFADSLQVQPPASSQALTTEQNTMKIRLIVDNQTLTATLDDNPSARDFYSLLPLTINLKDYAKTEKIAYLPRKLTEDQAPDGVDPDIGDLTYYAPWGNLALFYRDFGYSTGLIKLGSFADDDMTIFAQTSELSVRIEPW